MFHVKHRQVFHVKQASPHEGAGLFHVKRDVVPQARKSARSRSMAAFGLAPTMVFTTSPPW